MLSNTTEAVFTAGKPKALESVNAEMESARKVTHLLQRAGLELA
jgi:hypothetical protein